MAHSELKPGDLVRFNHERDGGPVYRIGRIDREGMVELGDMSGWFAPHLFELADDIADIPPKIESDMCQCPTCGRMHKSLGFGKPPAAIAGPSLLRPAETCPPAPIKTARELKCPGVGRDKDNIAALQFYFSRPVTDDEMRFLHDVMKRAAACMPDSCRGSLPAGYPNGRPA